MGVVTEVGSKVEKFKVGDKVRVNIDAFESHSTGLQVRKYNGLRSKISKVCSVKNQHYYELEGFVSEFGIPFSFVGDWLILCEESEGEQ